jgi:hypothetical protein
MCADARLKNSRNAQIHLLILQQAFPQMATASGPAPLVRHRSQPNGTQLVKRTGDVPYRISPAAGTPCRDAETAQHVIAYGQSNGGS